MKKQLDIVMHVTYSRSFDDMTASVGMQVLEEFRVEDAVWHKREGGSVHMIELAQNQATYEAPDDKRISRKELYEFLTEKRLRLAHIPELIAFHAVKARCHPEKDALLVGEPSIKHARGFDASPKIFYDEYSKKYCLGICSFGTSFLAEETLFHKNFRFIAVEK